MQHMLLVNCHCGSILNWTFSVLSFHATKIFNTFEGGAVVCPDKDTKAKLNQLKNFGFVSETDVVTVGINAKMNELQAAVGLLELQTLMMLFLEGRPLLCFIINILMESMD